MSDSPNEESQESSDDSGESDDMVLLEHMANCEAAKRGEFCAICHL